LTCFQTGNDSTPGISDISSEMGSARFLTVQGRRANAGSYEQCLSSPIKRDADIHSMYDCLADFCLRPAPHSAFSADLAPSDFSVFGTVKAELIRRSFHGAGGLLEAVTNVNCLIRPSALAPTFHNRETDETPCIVLSICV
jgi:hypothetical protein